MFANDPDGELRPVLGKGTLSWCVADEIRTAWQSYACLLPIGSTAAISMD